MAKKVQNTHKKHKILRKLFYIKIFFKKFFEKIYFFVVFFKFFETIRNKAERRQKRVWTFTNWIV